MSKQSNITDDKTRKKTGVKLLTLVVPVLLVGMLQVGGCMRRTPPPPPSGGTYISTDGGVTFEQSVMRAEPEAVGQHIARLSLGKAHRPVHDPTSIYIAGDRQGIVVSDDNGQSWRIIQTPLSSTVNVVALPDNILVASGTGPEGQGYIVRSLDGGQDWEIALTVPVPTEGRQFQLIKTGPGEASVVMSIASDPFDSTRIYGGSNLGTVFIGENSAQAWRSLHTLDRGSFGSVTQSSAISEIIPSPHRQNDYLVITRNRELFRISGGVQTEIKVPRILHDDSLFGHGHETRKVYDAHFVPGFPDALLVGVDNGILLTRDGGETWVELKVPIDDTLKFSDVTVTISPTNPNRFLVGFKDVLYRSEDTGQTWITFSLGIFGIPGTIADISIDPTNENNILVVTSPVRL